MKSPQIKLSLKPEQLDRLEEEAEKKSLSISSMARSLLMEKLEEITTKKTNKRGV